MTTQLSQLKAKDIMTPDVFMAYEGWSIKRLSTFFMNNKISGAPVIASDHTLVGVVSATDMINFESKSDKEKSEMVEEVYAEFVGASYDETTLTQFASRADERCTVNKVMTPKVIKVDEEASVSEVADRMLADGIRRIFVTKNGIMSGVISTSNILKVVSKIQ